MFSVKKDKTKQQKQKTPVLLVRASLSIGGANFQERMCTSYHTRWKRSTTRIAALLTAFVVSAVVEKGDRVSAAVKVQ